MVRYHTYECHIKWFIPPVHLYCDAAKFTIDGIY